MEIDELKRDWLDQDFDEMEFEAKAEEIVDFATASGETAPRFVDPSHPDFQAPPTFVTRFHGRRLLPEEFPKLGLPLDAGKAVIQKRPIRAGSRLLGRSHLHDIYEKTGRSGRMVFLVSRMELYEDGQLASIVDSRMVIREKPTG
ncbi:MAG: MaoC family dehydratase N-terminal domain-containing protein [Deltaproteobacteria bacterium]|nr:MaoC family dehydratase N-terminal domain-containing protein [Deltaproteobacteria bacterium]MBW2394054.1 MaoC family dehydratase N-terminal domain-containing protein [Deltaproteobacteria bacterium]